MLPELEQALEGATAGEEREATVHFPDDYPAEEVAGKTAQFKIRVREVREKELPELDDDFAAEASEFDTVAELREQIESRIREVLERQVAERFRESALDAAAENVTVELPESLITARAAEMWRRVERSLQRQGMRPRDLPPGARQDPRRADRRGPPGCRALAEARGRAGRRRRRRGDRGRRRRPSRGALPSAGPRGPRPPEPAEALEQLRRNGREELLRDDLRMRRAMELIAEESKPIPADQAEAREQIWTPEKERERRVVSGPRIPNRARAG